MLFVFLDYFFLPGPHIGPPFSGVGLRGRGCLHLFHYITTISKRRDAASPFSETEYLTHPGVYLGV